MSAFLTNAHTKHSASIEQHLLISEGLASLKYQALADPITIPIFQTFPGTPGGPGLGYLGLMRRLSYSMGYFLPLSKA